MPEQAAELGYDGPVIGPEQDFASVSTTLSDLVLERPTPRWWYVGAGISGVGFVLFVIACLWTFVGGVGVWGVNIPVAWGFALANYVWWIGIASGGTFISSLFYLIGSDWRNGVNRTAETHDTVRRGRGRHDADPASRQAGPVLLAVPVLRR